MRIAVIKFPYDTSELCEKVCNMADRLAYDVGVFSLDLNEQQTSVNGHAIHPFNDIKKFSWDAAVLACLNDTFIDVVPRMVELGVGTNEQFKTYLWLLQQLMIARYEDCADPVIQETLEYWKTHDISVFNQHIDLNNGTFDRVFSDEDLPYIYFKTVGGAWHKMYFPPNHEYIITYKDKKVVPNLLKEQDPNSPHLYTTDDHQVHAGDILIDAGVGEGNFALRYVDICSKIYLFEPDTQWIEPLKHTFAPFGDKVEFIPRYVSNHTDGEFITIDDALPDVRGKNIFLKMDVEGAEPDALRGAKNLLTNNKVRASVCTYHNADDLIKVKSILRRYGYQTSVSNGYMVFINGFNILDTADFRKGVVRAKN